MEYNRNLRVGVDGYTDNETVLDVYGSVNISRNISIAGTVTYDDVTNVDSTGLVTARSGIDIGYPGIAATLTANGNAVFSGIVTAAQFFGDGSGLDGVTGVSIVAQEVTGDPVYPTFASNVGVTTLGIAQTGFVYVPSTGSVGIGSTQPTAKLDVTGQTELDDVNVSGAITATTFTGDLDGNAGTATSLATARTIALTGDVVATATPFDGTSNISIAATIQPNSVALGDDTTGNYVATIAGTANEITVTGSGSETAAVTLSLPDDVTIGQDLTVTRNLDVSGNVNVVGVLTAERLYSNVYGEFTGGGISGTNIVGTSLSISGISTLGTLQISSGIVTATSGIITYYGDGSGLINTNFNGASKSVVKYIATDGQTTFVAAYELGYVDVYLNGVKLTADLYTSTSGTSIVLNDGAAANDVIEIVSFTFIEPSEADSANNIANKASSKYTATDGQTSFAATYEIGYVDVYLNGVKLTDDLYDATSGSAVILNDGAAAGDIVEIIAFTFHNFNVGIQSGGSLVGSAKTINFAGSGISSVTVSSNIATINITGGSSSGTINELDVMLFG